VRGVRFLRKFALFKPDSLASPAFEPVTLLLLNYGRTHVLPPNFGDAVRSVGRSLAAKLAPVFSFAVKSFVLRPSSLESVTTPIDRGRGTRTNSRARFMVLMGVHPLDVQGTQQPG
jgi:hypothetical protein